MPIPAKTELEAIDQAIKKGAGTEARHKLRLLARSEIARSDLVTVAALARRAGMPMQSLRLLLPFVRPTGRHAHVATDAEKIQYAASLLAIGGVEEARALLASVKRQERPEVDLYESLALFTRWEYAATIPLLSRYLSAPGLDSYARLVGRVNLASALVYEKRVEVAVGLIDELLKETREGRYDLLYAHTLELAAQLRFLMRDWSAAAHYLDLSQARLQGSGTLSELFLEKWRAFVAIESAPDSQRDLGRLAAIRAEARARAHWETLRDCDRFEAMATKDPILLAKVYFGTPYADFRAKLVREFPGEFTPPPSHVLTLGEESDPSPWILDSLDGSLSRAGRTHQITGLLLRLVTLLSADFYRPFRLATLHHHLYPGDFYNPLSSPDRVHRLIRRLRQWASRSRAPFGVEEIEHAYRLSSASRLHVRVYLLDPEARRLGWWKKNLSPDDRSLFSSSELAARLSLPLRSAKRLLKSGCDEGHLVRRGKGRGTRYRLAG